MGPFSIVLHMQRKRLRAPPLRQISRNDYNVRIITCAKHRFIVAPFLIAFQVFTKTSVGYKKMFILEYCFESMVLVNSYLHTLSLQFFFSVTYSHSVVPTTRISCGTILLCIVIFFLFYFEVITPKANSRPLSFKLYIFSKKIDHVLNFFFSVLQMVATGLPEVLCLSAPPSFHRDDTS